MGACFDVGSSALPILMAQYFAPTRISPTIALCWRTAGDHFTSNMETILNERKLPKKELEVYRKGSEFYRKLDSRLVATWDGEKLHYAAPAFGRFRSEIEFLLEAKPVPFPETTPFIELVEAPGDEELCEPNDDTEPDQPPPDFTGSQQEWAEMRMDLLRRDPPRDYQQGDLTPAVVEFRRRTWPRNKFNENYKGRL